MKKIIHYSREGYNGDLTETAVCGKIVKSNQEKENTSIHPDETNCNECKKTPAYKKDIVDLSLISETIKRRIYIESDILQKGEFHDAQRHAEQFAEEAGLPVVDRVFSQVLDFAWHDLEKTWEAVKNADEIYATSSLMPLSGGSYIGAPVIFNGMCERAIKENVTGKKVIIFNSLDRIDWSMIKKDLLKEAFKKNDLYMYNKERKLEKVVISKIKFK